MENQLLEIDKQIKELNEKRTTIQKEMVQNNVRLQNCWNELSNQKAKVWVVYWVDIDTDCPKKSEIEILGVYSNKKDAEAEELNHSWRTGYSDDDRCYYVEIKEIILNNDSTFFDDYTEI